LDLGRQGETVQKLSRRTPSSQSTPATPPIVPDTQTLQFPKSANQPKLPQFAMIHSIRTPKTETRSKEQVAENRSRKIDSSPPAAQVDKNDMGHF
jgi:hypothetical protein